MNDIEKALREGKSAYHSKRYTAATRARLAAGMVATNFIDAAFRKGYYQEFNRHRDDDDDQDDYGN